MVKTFFYGMLVSFIVSGILWFFLGRNNISTLEQTAKQISNTNQQAQQIGNSIRTRYDNITITVAKLNTRSANIENISNNITDRSSKLEGSSNRIKTGLDSVRTSVDRIENRNRQIVSIVGELRKTNDDFYYRIKSNEEKK